MSRASVSHAVRPLLVLAALALGLVWHSPCLASNSGPGSGKGMGPPPEMIEACSGKSSGDACSFSSPMGNGTGSCADWDGTLACRPKGGPGQPPQ